MEIKRSIGNKPIHIQKLEPIKSHHSITKYRLKILETDIRLQSMTHNGVDYDVIKQYSRGRYVVRKTDKGRVKCI